jgi:1,4-dihydroxy-2-naphthoate octaprenyltransferase
MNISLSKEDPRYRRAIQENRLHHEGSEWIALATEVTKVGNSEVTVFELKKEKEIDTLGFFLLYAQAFRVLSLTATLSPAISVFILGIKLGYDPNPFLWLAGTLGAVFLQIGCNVINDVQDHYKGIDLRGKNGGSRVIQKGWISAKKMESLGYASLLLGIVFGSVILIRHPILIGTISFFALIGAFGYSGKPFGLKYYALGDVAVLTLVGPLLTAGVSIASFDQIVPGAIILGLFFGFFAEGLLHINNLQDQDIDKSSDAKTLVTQLGFIPARNMTLIIYLFGYSSAIGVALVANQNFWILAPLVLSVPLTYKILNRVMMADRSDSKLLNDLRMEAAKLHLLAGILFCIGIGVFL